MAFIGVFFLGLLFGREVVIVKSGMMIIRIEILGIGVSGECSAARMHNLRTAEPDERAGTGWRGAHLAFDYLGVPVDFGSNILEARAGELLFGIRGALGTPIPDGPAPEAVVGAGDPPASDARIPSKPLDPEPSHTIRHESPPSLFSPSTIALFAANLVPLVGVILFGWDMGRIMVLYWAESAIIGVFNLLKMAVIGKWAILFIGPFFLGHFGGFMIVHLLFIYGFFIEGAGAGSAIPLSQVAADFVILWPALAALFMSHALSFYLNFIGRREYAGRQIARQMGEPYKRIMVMHVTIIFGGFLVMALDSTLPALMLLIVLKIAADVRAHVRERAGGAPEPA